VDISLYDVEEAVPASDLLGEGPIWSEAERDVRGRHPSQADLGSWNWR